MEDTGSIISDGFDKWQKNLNICLPFVFDLVISSALALIILGSAILATIPSFVPYLTNPPDEISPHLISQLLPQILRSLSIIIAAIIITIILGLLVSSFFTAGAIGMAKEAIKSGQTNLSDMKDYGSRKFIDIFFANLIIGLIAFAGVIFIIPGVLSFWDVIISGINLPLAEVLPLVTLFGLGFLAMGIYVMIISIIFAPSRYAIVIEDLRAVEGVKKGFRFFMDNKVDVFLIWLIVFAITAVSTFVNSIPYVGWIIGTAISVIIISPLAVIWWSRLYLNTSISIGSDELVKQT
ncbi:MAG: hypothetical protein PHI74_01460 [Methanocellales archaeon]|nr:hypothetical protein [Methanocellales archaeon]MDD5484683.1 hypothetical protein [Methanocellales archaeon]